MKLRRKIQQYFFILIFFLCFELSKQLCSSSYYYRDSEGKKKGISFASCKSKYPYILDCECRSSCEGSYQLKLADHVICFGTLKEVGEYSNPIFYEQITKQCWTSLPTDKYFIKSSSSENPREVVKECLNFYYKSSNYFYCVDNCSSQNLFFTKGDKRCLSSCNDFNNQYYYDPDTKECFYSCELSPNKKFYYPKSKNNPKCEANCPSSGFCNHNSYIILSSCGADNSINLYHKHDDNICYPSCLAIPEGIYIYELNNACWNHTLSIFPDGDEPYYYVKDDGVIKYTTLEECKDKSYIYLLGKQCKIRCDDFYYKKEVQFPISHTDEKFIKCFYRPKDCLEGGDGVIYYNDKFRKCWASRPTDFFVKNRTVTGSVTIYELVDECENFYFVMEEDNYYNYCTHACKMMSTTSPSTPTIDLFFTTINKKCEKDCINFNKYYYDPENNECVDICKGRAKYKFQTEITETPEKAIPCLESCLNSSEHYYNQDSYI